MTTAKREQSIHRRVLAGVSAAGIALLVGACSGAGATDSADGGELATTTTSVPVGWDRSLITINVDVTDSGFEPSSVFVPTGRGIQLVVRNQGSTEHHLRVIGVTPAALLWAARPDTGIEEGVTDEDHTKHHLLGFTDWRGTSPLGVRPVGDEIHGYALPSEMEIMRFIVTEPGTYKFEDVLHRDLTGQFTIFEAPPSS